MMIRRDTPAENDFRRLLGKMAVRATDTRITTERRYVISANGEPSLLVISIGEEGVAVGDDNYFVDRNGEEWPLTPDDEVTVVQAINATLAD